MKVGVTLGSLPQHVKHRVTISVFFTNAILFLANVSMVAKLVVMVQYVTESVAKHVLIEIVTYRTITV
jgi:sRNA-binding regulator protein Hfq